MTDNNFSAHSSNRTDASDSKSCKRSRTQIMVAAMAAALMITGIGAARSGGGDNHESVAKSSSSPPSPVQDTKPGKFGKKPGEFGKFTFTYEEAQSEAAIKGRSLMMDAHLLENVTQNVNDVLTLAVDVPVTGKQCNEANAFWDGTGIVMCYEYVEDYYRLFADAAPLCQPGLRLLPPDN